MLAATNFTRGMIATSVPVVRARVVTEIIDRGWHKGGYVDEHAA